MRLQILDQGSSEPLKAAVHGFALGITALMGMYNAAAWLRRRQPHLALNAVLYGLAIAWEQHHVTHHLDACRLKKTGSPVSAAPEPLAVASRKAA